MMLRRQAKKSMPEYLLPEENRRKIKTRRLYQINDLSIYGRFGFKADPRLVLENVPAEYFQVLAFSKTIPTDSIVYAEAFNATA